MRTVSVILLFIFSFVSLETGLSQQVKPKDGIKSITVVTEKKDQLLRKQVKESETWFDRQGQVTEEIKYDDGKVESHHKYEYDAAGNKIKEEVFDPSGRLKKSSEYRYEDNLRVEKIDYDQNGRIKLRKKYSYVKY